MAFATIDELEAGLRSARYLPERGLATALFLSLVLEKPLPCSSDRVLEQ